MSLLDPAWKKRSRPCPFYSQGRCLFADSCNFLHDVKIKAAIDPDALALARRHSGLHVATVDAPISIHSPPRSLRTSNLLSVLEDVIGPDEIYRQERDEPELWDGQEDEGLALSGMSAQAHRRVSESRPKSRASTLVKRPEPLDLSQPDALSVSSAESSSNALESELYKSPDIGLLSPVDLVFASNDLHERLSFPYPPSSPPISPEASSHLQIHVLDDVPRTASFDARFSLAQVMKESLVKPQQQHTWQDALSALQKIDEVGELQDEQVLDAGASQVMAKPTLATESAEQVSDELSVELAYLSSSSELSKPVVNDTVTDLYESHTFSQEEAAAKRMSWTMSSRGSSVARNDSLPPLARNSTLIEALDEYESAVHEELALEDSDGGGSSSRQRIRSASPATSISSRPGSRTGSVSSQRPLRRAGSLLGPRSGTPDGRTPSPLSSSINKGKDVVYPMPSSSTSSASSLENASKRVPFGFRNSFKGKRIQTRPRPPSLITSASAPNINASAMASSDTPPPSALRPLRLSRIFDSGLSLSSSSSLAFISPASNLALVPSRSAPSSHFQSLSSARSPTIPNIYDSYDTDNSLAILPSSPAQHSPPLSAPLQSWRASVHASTHPFDFSRPSSRLSEPIHTIPEDDTSGLSDGELGDGTTTIRRPLPLRISTHPATASAVFFEAPPTPVTSAPTLMFAIARDDPAAVRAILERGDVGPNDDFGPQSALAFALTAEGLSHRTEITKTLLAFGADPAALADPERNPPRRDEAGESDSFGIMSPPRATTLEAMDPATRYFVSRAGAASTRRASALVHRSFFRPITRARYDVIGQDRVFEQLFLVLNQHSRAHAVAPLVVLLCGPSGHGKSLLARKFASLLDVPAHTVNVTTLQSTHDLWQSHSMSPYEEPSNNTLAQFLSNNEGKRCVVVLDEIEKTDDPKVLYPLLMPWELGRCSLKAGDRHVDCRNVVWIGTSNVGHDLSFEYEPGSRGPDGSMSRADYLKLTGLLRPRVSDRLGASLVSRVTSVLPFVPFTHDEQMAIATEALYSVGGSLVADMSTERIAEAARATLSRYLPSEGARSLYRAASAALLEMDPLDDANSEDAYT